MEDEDYVKLATTIIHTEKMCIIPFAPTCVTEFAVLPPKINKAKLVLAMIAALFPAMNTLGVTCGQCENTLCTIEASDFDVCENIMVHPHTLRTQLMLWKQLFIVLRDKYGVPLPIMESMLERQTYEFTQDMSLLTSYGREM
jgi:hypothetical protein